MPADRTLDWLATEPRLTKWRDSDRPEALWITGSPGQGKSVLTKAIVGQLEESLKGPDVAVIYFFCYNQDPDYRTPSSVLRALIVQLLEGPDMFQHLPRSLQQDRTEFTSASLTCLWNIFGNMVADEHHRKIYCVIDALDECEDPQGELCSLLSKISLRRDSMYAHTVPALKILISSRPSEGHMERNLKDFPRWNLHANKQDLDLYVHSKLAELPAELTTKQKDLVETLFKERTERSFLWISIAMRKLAQIKGVTTYKLEDTIRKLPTELCLLYKKIIGQLKDKDSEDVLKLLLWVAYAKETLTIDLLEVAVSLDPRRECRSTEQLEAHRISLTPSVLQKLAGNLIEFTNGKVHFIHQSVKDYIVENNFLRQMEFLDRQPSPDLYLAKICMEYLHFEHLKDRKLEINNWYFPERQPMFYYAALHWFEHISELPELPNAMLLNIKSLLSLGNGGQRAWLSVQARFVSVTLDRFQFERTRCPQLYIAIALHSIWMIEYVLESGEFLVDKLALWDAFLQSAKETNEVFRKLLDTWETKSLDNKLMADGVMKGVALNGTPDNMRLLLEREGTYLITEGVLITAVRNHFSPTEMTALLLENEETTITENVLVAAFAACSRYRRWAARNRFKSRDARYIKQCPRAALVLLLGREKNIRITQKVLLAAVVNNLDEEMIKLLLTKTNGIRINAELLQPTARWLVHNTKLLTVLLDRSEETSLITDEVMKAAIQNGDYWYGEVCIDIVMMLFARGKKSKPITFITEEVMEAATQSGFQGPQMIGWFLDEQTTRITEAIVKAAVQNQYQGDKIVRLLLDRAKQSPLITENIMETAVQNQMSGARIVPMLLGRGFQELCFKVPNCSRAAYIVPVLLEKTFLKSCVTENVVRAAVMSGNVSVLEVLRHKVDLDIYAPEWGRIARFILAARKGDEGQIQQLLAEGVNHDLADVDGRTPLSHAAECGKLGVLKILHDRGTANVEPWARKSPSPLYRAVEGGFKSCARFLLDKGADPSEFWGAISPDTVVRLDNNGTVKTVREWVDIDDEPDSQSA